MVKLYKDVLLVVISYLTDKEKICFLSTTKKFHLFKKNIIFDEEVYVKRIAHLWYYDCFTNVRAYDSLVVQKFTNLKRLVIGQNCNCIVSKKLPNCIPHLIFGHHFNNDVRGIIPNSVTHLEFGDSFNQDIHDCIPNSVTHLEFGDSFNQDIRGCIPNSVTYLEFGNSFNQDIHGCIPNSVTNIIISETKCRFNQFPFHYIYITNQLLCDELINENFRLITHVNRKSYFERKKI